MKTKRVPVVIYEGGNRTVVGSAVVEVDGEFISVDAQVNMQYAPFLNANVQAFSLGPFVAPKADKE